VRHKRGATSGKQQGSLLSVNSELLLPTGGLQLTDCNSAHAIASAGRSGSPNWLQCGAEAAPSSLDERQDACLCPSLAAFWPLFAPLATGAQAGKCYTPAPAADEPNKQHLARPRPTGSMAARLERLQVGRKEALHSSGCLVNATTAHCPLLMSSCSPIVPAAIWVACPPASVCPRPVVF